MPTEGDRPLGPYRDTRITFAASGGASGLLLGFGIVLLSVLLDRRVRSPEDAKRYGTGGTMLGLLPRLPEDLSDPDQAALAAHCVHEIRTMLQISASGARVFTLTSAVAGTGKTSLAFALGASFAGAGFRTLLIDCDMVGAGLTVRLDKIVRRKIGRILCRQKSISDEQLQEALKLAHGTRRLGDILHGLGYLKEEELAAAIQTQTHESLGLLDVLRGDPLTECVAETGIPGLSALPLGAATSQHVGSLSPSALHQVLEEAKAHFDIVLVDTGPVPGSLEASVVASQTDAVVLAVSRGEPKPLIERSITQLRAVGGKVAGVVFNRAEKRDTDAYGSSRALISGASNANPRSGTIPSAMSFTNRDAARFGPVAQAVVGCAPVSPAGSNAVAR